MTDQDPGALYTAFHQYVAQTSPEPAGLEVASGDGPWLTDTAGRKYLDWLAGIGVLNLGHRPPRVLAAIRAQLNRHLHVMVYGEYLQQAQADYARALARSAPMADAQVYFSNSGAEAVEGALKLARKQTGRKRLVAFEMSYHGDTLGALSVLGRADLRKPFEPLVPEVGFMPFGWPESVALIDDRTAAVIIEPIQAEGGVRVPTYDFLPALRKRCTEVGALLIFDEVQTGLGRTGALWAGEHWRVTPDILVLAKALGGGLPLGAFLATRSIMECLSHDPPLSHLTTFGGHPVSCAAGLASFEQTLADDLVKNAAEQGEIVQLTLAGLREAGAIREVRAKGLLVGVELDSPARAGAVVKACQRLGLLVGQALHDEKVLRLTPPLNLPDDLLVKGLDILTAALTEVQREGV
jgi:acetylornithine/succinyldiaminopimelate/putrescine aminotransferase